MRLLQGWAVRMGPGNSQQHMSNRSLVQSPSGGSVQRQKARTPGSSEYKHQERDRRNPPVEKVVFVYE